MSAEDKSAEITRRSFMKRGALAGSGLVIANEILSSELLAAASKPTGATMIGVPFQARDQVRLGIIGVGGRGTSLLKDLLAVDKVEIRAICDLVPEKVARAQKAVTDAGQPQPTAFTKSVSATTRLRFSSEPPCEIILILAPVNAPNTRPATPGV